jgi:uncharacterized surface protein with fasciclin (FAS1) repeats
MTHVLTRTLTVAALFAVAATLAGPVQAQDKDKKAEMEKTADIVQVAQNNEDFSTLVTALKAADLVEALKGEGPFTVFAPTNEAFEALPDGALDNLLKPANKSELQRILTYHVLEGNVTAGDVTGLDEAKTLEGSKVGIETKDGTVMLTGDNQATVTKTDIAASNGVIHVIDAVLMPPAKTAMKDKKQ